MGKERILVDFDTAMDAKKVEETVKTGYAETTVENIVNWVAAEGDLADTYSRLASRESDQREKEVYLQLQSQSRDTIALLSKLLDSFESMDRARVRRIQMLGELVS